MTGKSIPFQWWWWCNDDDGSGSWHLPSASSEPDACSCTWHFTPLSTPWEGSAYYHICFVDVSAEAQGLNTLSKVNQFGRIRGEAWSLQKQGPWSLHNSSHFGQSNLLIDCRGNHSFSLCLQGHMPWFSLINPLECNLFTGESCTPLPTSYFWK